MKITIKQAVDLYNAITNLKEGGVFVKGLKNIDLAMNKKSVEPIVEGYNIAKEVPEKYKKFVEEIEQLQLKITNKNGSIKNPEDAAEKIEKLKEKHSNGIKEYEDWKEEMKIIQKEEKEINLIKIKKEDLQFSDDVNGLASEIVFGLLPCIEDS